ncbi:hypothetical protein EVAR_4815_1 [Eumeta japonica]|uniref:HORMA domain-containing protein n=1 Tax=Eumeta variegata TaxID=151549 RepID=A0A4C1SZQ7_EUMVA|nr:hypothetical protein EVAR_4815_1 [Eumeta japonica]
MKNLTTAAISNIAYTRDLCPMDCFRTVQFENINLRMFKDDCENERVQFFCVSLKSAFEALDKEYAVRHESDVLSFDISSGFAFDSNDCSYLDSDFVQNKHNSPATPSRYTQPLYLSFRGPNEAKQTHCDVTDIKEHTKSLMQFILVMTQSYPRLPDSTYITIRTYYNDSAPENYQAPNYTKGNTELDYLTESLNMSPGFGVVNTPFHQLTSYWFVNAFYDNKDVPMASLIPLPSANPHAQNSLKSDYSTGGTLSIKRTRCVCDNNINEELWDEPNIICKYCGEASHATCYGVRWRALKTDQLIHCCVSCAAAYGYSPTDPSLLMSSQKYTKSMCIIRQALNYCGAALEKGVHTLTPMKLMTVLRLSELSTHKLTSQLASFGVLVPRERDIGLTKICEISSEKLKTNMDKFFIPIENLPLRCTEGTSATRAKSSVFIEDLVGDMEKLNRQDNSDICRVVERAASEPDGVPEDDIFKLYYEVLPCQEAADDELPLSGSHNPIDSLTSKKNTHDCDTTSEEDEQNFESERSDRRARKRNAPNAFSTPAKMFKRRRKYDSPPGRVISRGGATETTLRVLECQTFLSCFRPRRHSRSQIVVTRTEGGEGDIIARAGVSYRDGKRTLHPGVSPGKMQHFARRRKKTSLPSRC